MRLTTRLLLIVPLALAASCGEAQVEPAPASGQPMKSAATERTPKAAPSAETTAAQAPDRFLLKGRVGDPWGDPISGASVRVVLLGSAEDATPVAETTSDDKGTYELELPGPGPWTVFGRHAQVGVHSVASGIVTAGDSNRAPELRLTGEGVLAGHLLDARRDPLAETMFVAFSRSLLRQEVFSGKESFEFDALPLWAPMLDSAFYRRGEGFHHMQATTAADGSFRLAGLAPGDYLIYTQPMGSGAWTDPERDWYTTGQESLELVSPLCNLEISIGDDKIGPATDDEAQRRRLGPLLVFPTVPSAHGGAALIARGIELHAGERNVFWVPPGDYVVRATTFPPPGQWGVTLHVEGRLNIQPGEGFRRYKLEFPAPDRPKGRLRVSVKVPEGFDAPKSFRLLTAETGMLVECSQYSGLPEPVYGEWLELPEGEYLVALIPFEDFVGRPEVVEMGNVYRRVVVEAGKDTECSIEATFGGRFRLNLDAERFVLGKDLVKPDDVSEGDWKALLRTMAEATGATIALQRDDAGPAFELRLKDPRGYLGERRKRMLAGEVFENFEAVEPGDYKLWVIGDGFEPLSVPIEIRAKELTEVSAKLVVE